MPHDPRVAVGLAAFSAALRARAGTLDRATVDTLARRAEGLLGDGDPLAGAVAEFARRYGAVCRDAAAVADLGRALGHKVAILSMPEPPDLGRKDIHG